MFLKRLFQATAVIGVAAGLALAGAAPGSAQAGFDAVVCHADTAYIYQYEDTGSARLDELPRGAHFQVYHQDGAWDFGVRNYNGVSGYVLSEKLCSAAKQAAPAIAVAPALAAAQAIAAAPASGVSPAAAVRTSPASVISPAVSGDRRCVDVPNGYIRNYPAGTAWTQLYAGQTFSVYEYRASGWARGYAWGHVNTDQSPYPAPYNDVWIETSNLGKQVNDGSPC